MIQSLKRKNLLYSLFIGCMFWGIAAIVLMFSMDSIQACFTKPVNFNELKAEDIKEGQRVTANIYLIYDYYSYYEENGKTISKEYVIPVGDSEYMGMMCSGTYMYAADNNLQLYWDYLDGKNVSPDSLATMQVEGTIMPLTGESLRYYNEFIDAMEWSEEDKQYFLPYVLMVDCLGDSNKSELIMNAIFFVFMVMVGCIMFKKNVSDSNIKELEKYCEAKGNKQMYMERIEQFYNSGAAVQGIRINTEYFMAVQKRNAKVFFAEVKDLLWVYPNVVRHSINMIPTGKTYALMVRTADGRTFNIPMKNADDVEEAIRYVAQQLPYLYFGYDENTEKFYNDSRQQMAEHVALRRQQQENPPRID